MIHKHILIGLLIAIVFFFVNIPLVSHYGLNWDEPTHYLRGQAFLRFFLTGKTDYQDLPATQAFRRSLYQTDERGAGTQTFSYYLSQPTGHPPLNGELASLSNLLFYQLFGIVGDIEGYRLFTLGVSSLLIFIVYVFVSQQWGNFAASVATIALLTYPLFFAESHFNIKDPVSASLYTATLYAFYKSIITKKIRWVIITSVSAGFALGTKFNILFLPITLFGWLAILIVTKKKMVLRGMTRRFVVISLESLFIIPIAILFVSYPALWNNSLASLLTAFFSNKALGFDTQYQPKEFFAFGFINTYPIQWLLFATPLATLILCLIGIVYALRKGISERYSSSLLILLWFLIPILRVAIGKVAIYGGLRQIMEFIPAMAILSGIGAYYLSKKFGNIAKIIIILSFIPITLKLISIHPNENVYFNPLIGGLSGAKARNFPDWGVTLGSVYQQGINWLNINAEPQASLALIRGLHSNIPRIKLRDDINFHNNYFSGVEQNGEYLMEVVDYNWELQIEEKTRAYLRRLKPVYTASVDGVPILKVWKNENEYEDVTVIAAAGDIACGPKSTIGDCREWETSEVIRSINPDAVLALGDLQYENGELEYFLGRDPYCQTNPPHCYEKTWGRFKDKTYPVPGNHEYGTRDAQGYFDYFNGPGGQDGRAGKRSQGYYSFNLGSWHIIALNSNCEGIGGCDKDSPQVSWLKDDLEKNNGLCTVAFWKHPRFSNGIRGDDKRYSPFWDELYKAGVEIVLNGSDHNYERFPRLNPNGSIDPLAGIRAFVVGTGGRSLGERNPKRMSRIFNNKTYGVLQLTLYSEGYDWRFVPIEGQTFTDRGSGTCR